MAASGNAERRARFREVVAGLVQYGLAVRVRWR